MSLVCSNKLSIQDSINLQDFPEFTIDLNKRPEERFVEVAKHFRKEIIAIAKLYMTQIPEFAVKLFDYTAEIWYVTQHTKYKEI